MNITDHESNKRGGNWSYPRGFIFILKAGSMACFTMAALTGFAEKSDGSLSMEEGIISASLKKDRRNGSALSERDKGQVRDRLYFLLEEEEARQEILKERLKQQKELRERIGSLWEAIQAADEEDFSEEEKELRGTEGSNGTKPGKTRGSNETEKGKGGEKTELSEADRIKRAGDSAKAEISNEKEKEASDDKSGEESEWQTIMALENSSYVKELFQEEERLMTWIKSNPEPLHLAVQYGNLELTRLFAEAEEGKMINAAREPTHFSPLHTALIVRRPGVIKFFLDHPKTDLEQQNIWGDNMFHVSLSFLFR